MNFLLRVLGAVPAAIAFVIVLSVLSSAPVMPAEHEILKPGEYARISGYCYSLEDAELLSVRIALDGNEGYDAFINDGSTKCVDSRFPQFPQINVVLLERLWEVEHPNGDLYEFWRVADRKGQQAWTWNRIRNASATPPGQGA